MSAAVLLLVAGVAYAGQSAPPSPERELAGMLSKLRRAHASAMRQAVMGGAEELRDAVAADKGEGRKRLADRLPGMSVDPFNLCRSLSACREAPLSLHVEDDYLVDDAFLALARPWIKLQEARGKGVKVGIDPGVGVKLELEDMPDRPVVILSASPTPTGGFDVAVEDGEGAARAYAVERAAVLAQPRNGR